MVLVGGDPASAVYVRSKTRPSLFGEDMWDLSLFTHLRVVLAYRGLEAWRTRWYLNIQTDGPVR